MALKKPGFTFLNSITVRNLVFNSIRLLSSSERTSKPFPKPFSKPDKIEPKEYDVLIVGGGIIGAATAREILTRNPNLQVAIVEKESELGLHQTTHNSGVVHAGVYYKPGSLKAKLCSRGLRLIYAYCDEKKLLYKKVGKIIVATTPAEVERLDVLEERSRANKVPGLRVLTGNEIQEVEPYCRGLKALWSPHTGIVDYRRICLALADDFKNLGGVIYLDYEVTKFSESSEPVYPVQVTAKDGSFMKAKYVLTCAGLYSDKLAVMSNCSRDPQIIPFRGEYLILHPSKHYMVKGNIYPVPDPRFPFLGVHFTPTMDGSVLLGPNAVLGFRREGYSWTDFQMREFYETVTYPGFLKMSLKYLGPGSKEMLKSAFTSLQMKDLQRYIPEITAQHVTRGPAGVRAQAMLRTGELVDDFVFSRGEGNIGNRVLHCRNAPSPAATSSLSIAKMLANKLKAEFCLPL